LRSITYQKKFFYAGIPLTIELLKPNVLIYLYITCISI